MIELRNLSKKFGERTILKNLSMRINEGETISIIGPFFKVYKPARDTR